MDILDKYNLILEKIEEQPIFDVNDVRKWLNSGDAEAGRCIAHLLEMGQIELCEDESGDSKYIQKEAAINNDSNAERTSERTINVVNVGYAQTGQSTTTNELGMREMQQRAYEKRMSQRLLIKAPPASGKSRALMFLALDKLHNQNIKKVIIAVPERSIGASFRDEDLTKNGFYWDWRIADGRMLKVANLVEDDPHHREPLRKYIADTARNDIDGLDIIVALGMAKEGFDWPFCEHALTIGYRGSFTEVVQIIGRCTRDSYNKTHAQFTNLIVKPAGTKDDVTIAVNNMLKAITVSLLMEQVLAPEFKFTPTPREPRKTEPGEIFIKGLKVPKSERGKQILQTDLEDLVAKTLQDDRIERAGANNIAGAYLRQVQTDIIRENYPGLEEDDIEAIRQNVAVKMAMTTAKIVSENNDKGDNNQFVVLANRFVKIDELDMNLIDSVNPFHHAFEVLSKKMDGTTFKLIQDVIKSDNINFTDDDALALVPQIQEFVDLHNGKFPSPHSNDSNECILWWRTAAGAVTNGRRAV